MRELDVGEPGPGDVLVDLRASGICHTGHQIMGEESRGILGHEAAGVVAAVGEGATAVGPGDHVMTNSVYCCWAPSSNHS